MSLLRLLGGFCGAVALAAAAPETGEIVPRLVWQGPDANALGAPSRDGRWFSYVDTASGDLAVRDLETGQSRFVTRKDPRSQKGEFAYFSVLSADGKTAAFAWFNDEGYYDLRVAEVPGPAESPHPPRVLYRNREAGFVQPCAFSPGAKSILTLFFRRDNISQIALVSTGDGAVRTLKSLNWIYPKRMDFSPDGRWIVYDNLSAAGAGERDIFLLDSGGRRETRLLGGPANDLFPLWSPDGREVLFLSDRSGSMGIWALRAADGLAAPGEPRLVRDGLGRALPLGLTAAGHLYYGLRAGQTDVHVVNLGAAHLPPPAIGDSPGRNSGAVFSPDGSTLAYLSARGPENYGRAQHAVLLYSLERHSSRELPVRLAHTERLAWSPDGRRLLLAGSDRRARSGLFEYELESGRTRPVVLATQGNGRGLEGTYAGNDEIVYVRPGSPQALVLHGFKDQADRVLYEAPGNLHLAVPAVSAGGLRLAFAQVQPDGGGKGDILLLAIPSRKTERLLTLPGGRVIDLAWMPGGQALLVGTEGSSGSHLWHVSASGDTMRPALPAPRRKPGISVHPDGRKVAVTLGEDRHEIWVLEHAIAPASRR
ncbi:MAG: PD40 domain-containing protein [Bryobacterales bacterium]|nr:PD40 domain-containing protein [Bryobacterales bacterium]